MRLPNDPRHPRAIRVRRRAARLLRALLGCAGWVAALVAASPATALITAQGAVYPVSAIEIEYALDHPRQIPVADLLDTEVGLAARGAAYVAPRPVDRTVRMRLSSLPPDATLSADAIQHIAQYLVATFNRRGFHGVIVTVPDVDERTGADLRPAGRTMLRFRIWTGRVTRLTTLADGDRFRGLSSEERTNLTAHAWIRERSPVQPGGLRGLLGVGLLSDYAAMLSRHPGRRVDVELTPGPLPGTTDVNLRVTENKPWLLYGQYSNTGTDATTKNRERFGFVDNQLLGRDDILRLDYTTGDFSEVHAVSGSYAAPFVLSAPAWRWRISGLYSEYDASEVGFVDSQFHGDQWLGEAQLVYNAYQLHALFVDVFGGARYHHMSVDNDQFSESGSADFVVPQVGVAADRTTRTSNLAAVVSLDVGVTDQDEDQLRILGTPNADRRFVVLDWDGGYSFYLEPLIDRQAWEDPSTPGSSTLAHEIAVRFRGQYAFDNRLVPQYQEVAGGLFSVRGYEQAQVARDNLVLGSAEYRLHLPRLLYPSKTPPALPLIGDFRVRPGGVYGSPDWDLVLRVFTDAAWLYASDPSDLDDETDETLLSVGTGLELQLLRNINVRVDVGHVLSDAGSAQFGDTRAHVLATLVY